MNVFIFLKAFLAEMGNAKYAAGSRPSCYEFYRAIQKSNHDISITSQNLINSKPTPPIKNSLDYYFKRIETMGTNWKVSSTPKALAVGVNQQFCNCTARKARKFALRYGRKRAAYLDFKTIAYREHTTKTKQSFPKLQQYPQVSAKVLNSNTTNENRKSLFECNVNFSGLSKEILPHFQTEFRQAVSKNAIQ